MKQILFLFLIAFGFNLSAMAVTDTDHKEQQKTVVKTIVKTVTMKSEIINYFKTDRSFAAGKVLYSQCANKNKSIEKALNRSNNSPRNLSKLHYQLWKLTGLPERQLKVLLNQPVVKEEVLTPISPEKLTPEEILTVKLAGVSNLDEASVLLNGLEDPELIELVNEKIVELTPNPLEQIPEKVKQGIKLREQFPFLKGDNYPAVYKELVSDLITAYEKYVAAQPKLFKKYPEAELLQVTKDVVEPYAENKAIYKELEHYQANGEPLGKHPIFAVYKQKEKLKAMNAEELGVRKTNVVGYINNATRDFKEAKEANNDKKMASAKARIEKYENEKAFISTLLKTK